MPHSTLNSKCAERRLRDAKQDRRFFAVAERILFEYWLERVRNLLTNGLLMRKTGADGEPN
jgi:hypothetical protein